MRLKKLEKTTYKKVLLLVIFSIIFIGISLLLSKIQVNNEKRDVYFAYYNGNTWLEEIPQKNNYIFEKAVCDDDVTVEWNEEKWAPLVLNLEASQARCTLYFTKIIHLDKDIPLAEIGTDGLFAVEHNNLSELNSNWNKTEYRYAGVNPDNYVRFNNELWRIIGLVNVQTANGGVEQRVKIIRTDGIDGQKDFENYTWDRDSGYINNWTTAKLKDMLNGIYYNSETGSCYIGDYGSVPSQGTCDFSGNGSLPKGLDDTARNMLDDEVIWNLGGWASPAIIADEFYEKERGTSTYNSYPNVWTIADDATYHKGIGLMYPSDYGYAVGGTVRNNCLKISLGYYGNNNCMSNDWLKPSSEQSWTITPNSSNSGTAFYIEPNGYVGHLAYVDRARVIWPTAYLKSSVKITGGSGTSQSPYALVN